jgi:alginate O-acetyltransferase complex protein AlgI
VFYGWWSWEFLGLIALSTAVDFLVGLRLDPNREAGPNKKKSQLQRKAWLGLSIAVNLGLLGYFKYAGFFVQNWIDAWASLGIEMHASTLKIILPVGISFYTFQTLSYSIDVYREKLKPSRDIVAFAGFVAFFPQLVAGPIERATRLLPQLSKPRKFSYDQAASGMKLILWGLFKKVVLADMCAVHVNEIFSNPASFSFQSLCLGLIYFAFQIYGDFSGYSNIAIGIARLLGIKLTANFKSPYISQNIAEFWRRWHISLSTWFRDYLYIPLGGSRVSRLKAIRNVYIIFIVSGFWHGANWTFVIWGAVHATLFLPMLLLRSNRTRHDQNTRSSVCPSIAEFTRALMTFSMVCIAWTFFRAENATTAVEYLSSIAHFQSGINPSPRMLAVLPTILFVQLIDWFSYIDHHPRIWSIPTFRCITYSALSLSILLCWPETSTQFIYFQF